MATRRFALAKAIPLVANVLMAARVHCVGVIDEFELKTPSAPWDAKDFVRSPSFRRFSVALGGAPRARGYVVISENPWSELSVVEPAGPGGEQTGGCARRWLSPVDLTAEANQCDLAVSAGFYKTSNGE
jgi:hypothetical protein